MSRHARAAAALLCGAGFAFASPSGAQGTLRLGMTAADIPRVKGFVQAAKNWFQDLTPVTVAPQ